MEDVKAVIVRCGNEEYAIPVESVVSIERLEHIHPVPHLPEFLLGLMRIRGELVPILDLERILYNRSAVEEEEARVVVVQTDSIYIGLLVLEAKEIMDLPAAAMTSPDMMVYARIPYFTTVANLENRMMTVMDPNILAHELMEMDEMSALVEAQKNIQA